MSYFSVQHFERRWSQDYKRIVGWNEDGEKKKKARKKERKKERMNERRNDKKYERMYFLIERRSIWKEGNKIRK